MKRLEGRCSEEDEDCTSTIVYKALNKFSVSYIVPDILVSVANLKLCYEGLRSVVKIYRHS